MLFQTWYIIFLMVFATVGLASTFEWVVKLIRLYTFKRQALAIIRRHNSNKE